MGYGISSLVRLGTLAGVLVLACSVGAVAGYGDVFDPSRVGMVGPREATSTCIGDPRTPECALDTLFACVVRRDIDLCRRIGIDETFARQPCFDPRILDIRYKIEEVRVINERNMPPYLKKEKREGEVYADVVFSALMCRSVNLPCMTFNIGAVETFKSLGRGWVVARFPSDADQCGPDGDD